MGDQAKTRRVADLKVVVPKERAPREQQPPRVTVARINLVPKVADAPMVIEDRMLAALKANAVPMVIVVLKSAGRKGTVVKGTVVKGTVMKGTVVRKVIAVPRRVVRKGAALREIVVRRVRMVR